ncbi:MAG: NADPH-dependent F420 reductase, partial [Acidimicrobiales bacterium]
GPIAAIEEGQPESRWMEAQLGHPVVKAFNCIRAQDLLNQGRPAGATGRRALPVTGDDPRGKGAVMALIDDMGFDPVDAGGLDESWRQQPGTPTYLAELDADGVRHALAAASPERPADWRA